MGQMKNPPSGGRRPRDLFDAMARGQLKKKKELRSIVYQKQTQARQ